MKHRMIMLVEDNNDNEKLVLRAREKSNLPRGVVVAHDRLEAIDYLFDEGSYSGCDTGTVPQPILLDLGLPKRSSLEDLRCIRADERISLPPVVILTGSKEEQDTIKRYKLCAISHINKPVDFAQLVEVVPQVASYWQAFNITPPKAGEGVE